MIAPLLLLAGDSVRMALGSGGGKRIHIALLRVIGNTVFGTSPCATFEVSRLRWGRIMIQVEPWCAETALAVLVQRWPVNRTSTSEV
jgi:gamma-glutamyltranspeptidase